MLSPECARTKEQLCSFLGNRLQSGFREKTGTKLKNEFSYAPTVFIFKVWRALVRCLPKSSSVANSAEFQIKLAETAEEVENVIKQYAMDTRSTFVVYKKDKSFGSLGESLAGSCKLMKANLEF